MIKVRRGFITGLESVFVEAFPADSLKDLDKDDLQRRFGENFGVGIAYNFYTMKLESRENDLTGSLQIRHSGPALFVSAGF